MQLSTAAPMTSEVPGRRRLVPSERQEVLLVICGDPSKTIHINRTKLAILIIAPGVLALTMSTVLASNSGGREWVKYAEKANGDLYFYDSSRVKRINNLRHVWNGVRYKTSVMGAASFLSLLEIDCSERTEKTLQNTFFSDEHWKRAAMKTDTTETPKNPIAVGSTTEQLTEIVCD